MDNRNLVNQKHGEDKAVLKEYWIKRLSGELSSPDFMYDSMAIDFYDKGYSKAIETLPIEISKKIIEISKDSDIRLYVILVTGLTLLLNKYTGEKDILLGVPVYKNEIKDDTDNKVLILRNIIDEKKSFKETVLQVSQSIFQGQQHFNYPIETILEDLDLYWDSINGNFPLFNIGISLENIHDKNHLLPTNPNVIFVFNRIGDSIEIKVEYKTSLYEKDTIDRIKKHFINLLREVILQTDIKLRDIAMLTDEEKKQLVYDFNDTFYEFPRDKTIHQLFEEQVKKTPNSIALVYEDEELTYTELNSKSNQFADFLRKKGIGAEDIVAIIMDRSIDMIVTLMGILKAGAAYMPISPEIPLERISSMLQEARAKLLISNTDTLFHKDYIHLQEISKGEDKIINLVLMDQIGKELAKSSAEKIEVSVGPENLAYIMFTSGSTGRPKGVMIEHRSAVNTLNWFGRISDMKEGERIILMYDYTSDPSVEDIFAPLIFGGILYVTDKFLVIDKDRFRNFVDKNKITILNFVPRVIKELLTGEPKLESLRVVLSGGEELEDSFKDELLVKGYEVFNDYGPTEATIDCLSEKCTHKSVTIGKPIDNMQCYVLDNQQKIVPIGVMGELYVAGVGLARGYINRPDLTNDRFIPNPFIEGEKMYRTGDLVRWRKDGSVEFFGRIDSQVKIRGFRIELGEIEMQLRNHPEIKDATVIVRRDGKKDDYLCGYIVPQQENCSISEIREYLHNRLPNYMIPSYFVEMERIPLNLVGKVDKSKLPKPEVVRGNTATIPIEFEDEIHRIVYEAWVEVLGDNQFELDDNFFELGGTSMDIIRVNNHLKEVLEKEIPVVTMFKYPTVNTLVEHLKSEKTT